MGSLQLERDREERKVEHRIMIWRKDRAWLEIEPLTLMNKITCLQVMSLDPSPTFLSIFTAYLADHLEEEGFSIGHLQGYFARFSQI